MFKELMERAQEFWAHGYNIGVRAYLHDGSIEVMAGERLMTFNAKSTSARSSLAKNSATAFAHLGACAIFLEPDAALAASRAAQWVVPVAKAE